MSLLYESLTYRGKDRVSEAEVRLRKLSSGKRQRRVHKHRKDDYYTVFSKNE